jgi:hypothetical protein
MAPWVTASSAAAAVTLHRRAAASKARKAVRAGRRGSFRMSSGKPCVRELALRARMVAPKSLCGKADQGGNHDYFSIVIKPEF